MADNCLCLRKRQSETHAILVCWLHIEYLIVFFIGKMLCSSRKFCTFVVDIKQLLRG